MMMYFSPVILLLSLLSQIASSIPVIATKTTQDPPPFDLENLCIEQILSKISDKSITCVNVAEFFLDRMEKYNPVSNAVINWDAQSTLEWASKLDSYSEETGQLYGPLHCVPILIKDNILVKGFPMTLGLRAFAENIVDEDAPAVEKVRAAGALIMGKANMAPLAIGTAYDESQMIEGYVPNPYAENFTSAASSNGNAAALAARFAVLGLATDSYGSVTGPASVTHTVGFRPPIGSFDMSGFLPMRGADFDALGMMALKASDVGTLFRVLTGRRSLQEDGPRHHPTIKVGVLGNLTYGRVTTGGGEFALSQQLQDGFRHFEYNLRSLVNVSVDISWDRDAIDLSFDTADSSLCSCLGRWMDRFLNDRPMRGADGRMVENLTSLIDEGVCVDRETNDATQCDDQTITQSWQKWLPTCAKKSGSSCRALRKILESNVEKARQKLTDGIFQDYDVLVFTQDPRILTHREAAYLNDFGGSFAFPSLTIPIGFTTAGDDGGDDAQVLPQSVYMLASPEKTHLMLSLAQRYEDTFWNPQLPPRYT